ncbi:hypothetical protein [Metabacillus sp. FJAT-53654]|uniref:Uncharacterized protein n=1 Tax=Metabacillus rhizosphaerae TaxID=3117747 RepID=A0ABZ2MWL5_9BACI
MMYLDRNNLPPTFGELKRLVREEGREKGIEEGQKLVAVETFKRWYACSSSFQVCKAVN